MADIFDKKPIAVIGEMAETGVSPYYRTAEPNAVMAGCNDYLGLATDPRLVEAAATATARYGTSCSGSRILNGTLPLHEELEARLAAFLGCEAALVTTTGFQANLAVGTLLGPADAAFSDMANHASLVDGVQLGQGTRFRYRHGDLAHLRRLLAAADPAAGKLIVTDGMFSMEGDLCPLPGLRELADRYGARLVVDGAHDIGLLGARGSGVAEHFGLPDAVDLYSGTFSKCFGSLGGLLAGPARIVEYLRYSARPVLFSAAMSPASAAAALTALDIIETEPARRERVFDHAERLHNGLRALGFATDPSITPVVPVHVGRTRPCLRMWQALHDAGVHTNAVVAPAVPRGRALIRVTPQATHTDEQITRILDAFATCGRRLGLVAGRAEHDWTPVALARPKLTG
ncbi:aminotransferase class I/II-fold pyridoxal phosphate-dependent enzyme [Streptomyces mayteni]